MKLFRKNIIKFFSLLIVFNFGVFFVLRQAYFSSRIPVIKSAMMREGINANDTLNVVLGSSHAFYGINSNLLGDNFYNFSSISQGLQEDFAVLKSLSYRNFKMKTIVLTVSLFSNGGELSNVSIDGERLRRFDYEFAYDLKYPIDPTLKDRLALLSEISKVIFSPNDELKSIDGKGNYLGSCEGQSFEISNAREAFERHSQNLNFERINPYIDSIAEVCSQKSIDLILVCTPTTKSYRELCETTNYSQFLLDIQQKMKFRGFSVLNFQDYFSFDSESTMLKDADHLSPCGQEMFSNYLSIQLGSSASFN